MSHVECSRCDAEADDLPDDWQSFQSPVLGTLHLCAACAKAAERPARAGHNGDDAPSFSADSVITAAAQSRLKSIIERIERLEEDKAEIMNDMKEIYDEAKGEGYDVKILRKVVRLLKMDKVVRDEEETILDMYLTAIGER